MGKRKTYIIDNIASASDGKQVMDFILHGLEKSNFICETTVIEDKTEYPSEILLGKLFTEMMEKRYLMENEKRIKIILLNHEGKPIKYLNDLCRITNNFRFLFRCEYANCVNNNHKDYYEFIIPEEYRLNENNFKSDGMKDILSIIQNLLVINIGENAYRDVMYKFIPKTLYTINDSYLDFYHYYLNW